MKRIKPVCKVISVLSLLCCLALTVSVAASDAVETEGGVEFAPHIQIGVEAWYTFGEAEWEISFAQFDPFFFVPIEGRSVLEWEDIDSLITIISAQVEFVPWLRLSGRYGSGSVDDGKVTDEDYVTDILFGIDDLEIAESVADSDGNTTLYDVNLHLVLSELKSFAGYPGDLELFVGYRYYADELTLKNPVTTVMDAMPTYEPFPPGPDSTYDFTWKGINIGVAGGYPLMSKLSVAGSIAAIAVMDFEGEAFWAQRPDFRPTSPNFVQEADSGLGFEGNLSLTYMPWEHLGVELGYRYMHWEAEDGTDRVYFADGFELDSSLDNVESTRHGAFLQIFGRY